MDCTNNINYTEGRLSLQDNRHESYLRPFFCKMMPSGYQWCVLHSSDNLPYYSKSDVDIVISGQAYRDIENIIHDVARETGWYLVQILWYDIQNCMYYVLKNKETKVHLAVDILYDPEGIGKYGFKTSTLTNRPRFNGIFNQTNNEVEFAYKLVKRVEKKIFKESDRQLLLSLFRGGNKEYIKEILYEQYGEKPTDELLTDFHRNKFPNFTDTKFSVYKAHHFIKRKLLTLQFLNQILWKVRRVSNRIFQPCGMAVYLPFANQEDTQNILNHLKAKLDLSFRFYIIVKPYKKMKIINALMTSKLCLCPTGNTNGRHFILMHWKGTKVDLTSALGNLCEFNMNKKKYENYIDILVTSIEQVLIHRIKKRARI